MLPKNELLTVLLFAEDRAQKDAVTRLATRVLCEERADERTNWIREEHLAVLMQWCGVDAAEPFTPLKHLDAIAKSRRIRVHGNFKDGPGKPDAAMCLKAFRIAHAMDHRGAVVIARDLDRARTREGYEQARSHQAWSFAILLAAAEPEIEAWFAVGFIAQNDQEHELVRIERKALGFDPTRTPERLRSTAKSSKDAKDVMRRLTADDDERLLQCLEAPLAHLREHGTGCGLAAFIKDVEQTLLPLICGGEAKRL